MLRAHLRSKFGRRMRSLSEDAPAPRTLMLESSSLCNLSCGKCPRKGSARRHGLMDPDLAFSVIDQASGMGVPLACLSMLGEPLLHPDLERLVARARERRMHPYFVTNAALLDSERVKSLLAAGLGHVAVSVDGWDEGSYRARQGADLGRLIENVSRFREIRGKDGPRIMSVSVIDRESMRKLVELKHLLGPVFDYNAVVPLMDFGIPGRGPDPGLLPGRSSWWRAPCLAFWDNLNVGWDGRVTGCCDDHDFLLEYQDARERPLAEIWRDQAIRRFRRLHIDRRFSDMPMCGSCTQDYEYSLAFTMLRYRFQRL